MLCLTVQAYKDGRNTEMQGVGRYVGEYACYGSNIDVGTHGKGFE